jgi:poly-gamma-glutamate capsule biosynthesis protein CapA/YwtB (metallophosphatase superfamily)
VGTLPFTIALAGDTMLGRGVAAQLLGAGPRCLVSQDVRDVVADADLFMLNLECCISDRGERWPAPGKRFFFRAPPLAVEVLTWLGVDAVTLANNHALDFGPVALIDTVELLAQAGILVVGAGPDEERAREPVVVEVGGLQVGILGFTDHPVDFAAGPNRPGVAYADLHAHSEPAWVLDAVDRLRGRADVVLVTPHWGPNMTSAPPESVRRCARALRVAGADLVAGHSAHVPHGVANAICFDLGDFVDDYAVDPLLRNDLGLLFLVTIEDGRSVHVRAVPLALEYCHTRLAVGEEYRWMSHRFTAACAELGSEAILGDGTGLVVRWA